MIPSSLKPTVTRHGRGKGAHYIASLGPCDAAGLTRDDALAELAKNLDRLARDIYKRRYLHCPDGSVFCVYATAQGYAYDITRPGQSYASTCMANSALGFERVVEMAERHAADSFDWVRPGASSSAVTS